MTWTITEHLESSFEKVGRLYIEGENLMIRSDLDHRRFRIPLSDITAILDGDTELMFVLDSQAEIGTVRLSTSGRAMNFAIEPFFYTTPLQAIQRVLTGD
ncbi:MAG TPA: hypothetical protein PLU94_09815 [Methanoregulaceae archaeon]|nr:hypothetical protein [Methanoregulaceae archaeon]